MKLGHSDLQLFRANGLVILTHYVKEVCHISSVEIYVEIIDHSKDDRAKLISAFDFATCEVQFIYFLNPKFPASSHLLWLLRLVYVGPVQKPHCWFTHKVSHLLYLPNCSSDNSVRLMHQSFVTTAPSTQPHLQGRVGDSRAKVRGNYFSKVPAVLRK